MMRMLPAMSLAFSGVGLAVVDGTLPVRNIARTMIAVIESGSGVTSVWPRTSSSDLSGPFRGDQQRNGVVP